MIHYTLDCHQCDEHEDTRKSSDDIPANVVIGFLEKHHRHNGVWVTSPLLIGKNPPQNKFGALDG